MHEPAETIESMSGLHNNLEEKEEENEVFGNTGVDLNNKNFKELLENDIKEAFNKHMKRKYAKIRAKVLHKMLMEKNDMLSTNFVEH